MGSKKRKYVYKPRVIKSINSTKKTHPLKNKREMKSLMLYFLKNREIAETDCKFFQAYRNYILLLLGFNTAFRAEDLIQLRVDKIKKGYVSITEFKTKKIMNFRMNKGLYSEILDYIETFKLCDYDFLFTRDPRGFKPLTRQRGDDILYEAADAIKLRQDFSMHSMRKTFAYHFYLDTGKLLTLQRMLNHVSPAITLLYIEWDTSDMEQEREKTYYSGVKN